MGAEVENNGRGTTLGRLVGKISSREVMLKLQPEGGDAANWKGWGRGIQEATLGGPSGKKVCHLLKSRRPA